MATPIFPVARGTDHTVATNNIANTVPVLLTNSNASATITIYANGPQGAVVLPTTAMTYVSPGIWSYRVSGAFITANQPLYFVTVVTDTSVSPAGLIQEDGILQEGG